MPSTISPIAPARVDLSSNRPVLPQAAIDTYSKQLESIFHHDALSLARGETPTREGDPLTDEQRSQLASATKTLVLSLPVGALSPQLASALQDAVADRDLGDVANLPLSKLGKVGQNIAEQFLSELKSESPASYYALAAASAGAVGYVAYAKGSDGLSKLGIKPEAKLKLFGDKLALKARAEWDPHFTNVNVLASATSSFDLGPYARVNGQVDFDRNGFDNASISASYTRDEFEVSGRATYDHTGRASAGVDAIYRPRENVELAASASVAQGGDARVGLGLRVRF